MSTFPTIGKLCAKLLNSRIDWWDRWDSNPRCCLRMSG